MKLNAHNGQPNVKRKKNEAKLESVRKQKKKKTTTTKK